MVNVKNMYWMMTVPVLTALAVWLAWIMLV